MTLERVIVDGKEEMIELKPITIIATDAYIQNIEYPDRMVIDCEMTLHHARLVKKMHDLLPLFLKIMSRDGRIDIDKVDLTKIDLCGTGYTHVIGLLDISLKFADMNVPFVWKHPETHLHPSTQSSLGTIVCYLNHYMTTPVETLLTSADPISQELGKAMRERDQKKNKQP